MEIRVKERLIGAIVLVALIVLLVPEILSGPRTPPQGAGDAQSERQYTIELPNPEAARWSDRQAAAEKPAAPTPLPAPAEAKPSGGNREPTVEVMDIPPAAPAPQTQQTQPQEQRAEQASPAPQPEPQNASAPAQAGDWAVQLGSFASADNAERLVAELKRGGYKNAYISNSGSGTKARHRVRIGPLASRAQAEELVKKLKQQRRQAAVVAPT